MGTVQGTDLGTPRTVLFPLLPTAVSHWCGQPNYFQAQISCGKWLRGVYGEARCHPALSRCLCAPACVCMCVQTTTICSSSGMDVAFETACWVGVGQDQGLFLQQHPHPPSGGP